MIRKEFYFMGLQYVTPTGWTDESVTATTWYDECLWKEFTFGDGADEEYMDDIDEVSPTEA